MRVVDSISVVRDGARINDAADGDVNVTKSARNIPGVKPVRADFINVYDLLAHEKLVITKDAVARVEEVFS